MTPTPSRVIHFQVKSPGEGLTDPVRGPMYTAKDAILFEKECPWIETMELEVGNAVQFQVAYWAVDRPVVGRVVKVESYVFSNSELERIFLISNCSNFSRFF